MVFDRFAERLEGAAEELSQHDEEEPEPRSVDNSVTTVTLPGYDQHRPESRDMERHWELFKTVPVVREPIRAFSSEVIAPGYWVDAGSDSAREDLEDWLESACIIEGEVDKDFRELVKKASIQREARGTALVEKVYAESDEDGEERKLYGFKLINPETVKVYTKPGQTVLLPPDATVPDSEDVKTNDRGETAAYVQFDNGLSRYDEVDEVRFTREDIIKLTRDADVGSVFGVSRIQAVADRVEALEQKLENNDKAIESLAYPFWLFKFGTEDQPWQPKEIREFMENHSRSEFTPGMKQGVQGNVDIDTISGDVADIQEYLQFDIDWIMSEMPLPKYALGGFEENINQFVSRSQETRVEKQLEEARQEIQAEWNPVLKEKAEEMGHDPEEVELKFGKSPEQKEKELEEEKRKQEIQNAGDENGSDGGSSDSSDEGTDTTRPPASSEQDGDQAAQRANAWDTDVAELADPRFVSVHDQRSNLAGISEEVLLDFRDRLLDRLEDEADNAIDLETQGHIRRKADQLERIADSEYRKTMRSIDIEDSAYDDVQTIVEETLAKLEGRHESLSGGSRVVERQMAQSSAQQFSADVERVAEDMMEDVRVQFRRALNRGERPGEARQRVEDRYDDGKLANRSELIAHMTTHGAIEEAKLQQFEASEEIVGVKPISTCSENTTPICENLAGCDGDPAIVRFDSEKGVSEQLTDAAYDDQLHEGFNPLPSAPPWHYGCSTQFVGLTEEDLE